MSPLKTRRCTQSLLATLSIAACILGASSAALAADAMSDKTDTASTVTGSAPSSARSVTVSYRDLDLQTVSGSRALEGRITRAAHEVCDATNIRNLAEMAAGAVCQRDAVANALAAVHSAHPSAQYAVNLARR